MRAVAREVAEGPIDVYAWGPSAAPAVAFAAREPELIRRLVLANPCVSFRALAEHSPLPGMLKLAADNYGVFVTVVLTMLGVQASQQAELRRTLLEQTPAEAAKLWLAEIENFDASDELGGVRAPTMLLHARTNTLVDAPHVESIAAGIPHAQLITIDSAPMGGMLDTMVGPVIDFLDGLEISEPSSSPTIRMTGAPQQPCSADG